MVRRVPGPDRFEKGVRFVVGALFAVLVGFFLYCFALRFASSPPALGPWLIGIAVVAALVGALAAWYGDRFWGAVSDALWWMPRW